MEAFVCITNTGTTTLGPNINIYSNVDNYSSIIVTVPLTSLIAPNCPYLVTVPDGATQLRLIDPTSGCCFALPFGEGFNICEICEPLGFDNTTNPSVGSISVGQLTGGCDPNISNYYLEWYGPGTGSTNMLFTSGFGNNTYAGNYQWTHPLTGDSQIYLYAGQYRPKIKEVELDNFIFSSDYGAYGDCFQDNPFVVLPYTTQNGSFVNSYQHCIEFNSESTFPSNNFNGTIELSANTKYVPYRFNSGPQADLLRIYFSGANYLTPILVESLILGSFVNSTQLTTEFDVNLPSFDYKTWGSPQTFTKVLCLTGLTRSANDVLLFDIDPQGTQSPTSFSFCFTQLQSFDCEMCALTNPYYKIQQSTVSAATGTCGSLTVQFNVSGCSTTVDQNEDLYKYFFSGSGSALLGDAYGSVQKNITLDNLGQTFASKSVLFNVLATPSQLVCQTTVGPNRILISNVVSSGIRTITIKSVNNPIETGYGYISNLYKSYQDNISAAISQGYFDPGASPNDPVYWGYITLYLPPYDTINSLGQTYSSCTVGNYYYYDPLVKNGEDYQYSFASPTLTVTTGTTAVDAAFGGSETLYITIQGSNFLVSPESTIMTNTFPVGPCFGTSVAGPIDSIWQSQVNALSTSLTFDAHNGPAKPILEGIKFNTSSNPWKWDVPTVTTSSALFTSSTFNKLSMFQYENKTYPLTGSSGNYGVKVSESAITCPNITTYTFDENSGTTTLNNYVKYHYYFTARFQNNNDQTKYELLATPISPNGQPDFNTAPTLIGSGNTIGNTFTVIDNNFFI